MPQVSVVIPVHNPGRFLRPALASVFAQSFTDFEVTVIDDASVEDLSWVPDEFPRVRVIRQSHAGVSVARNRGILCSGGAFISLMDQDDMWHPRKLERQVGALLDCPDAGMCHST